jgi:hypothetical protein
MYLPIVSSLIQREINAFTPFMQKSSILPRYYNRRSSSEFSAVGEKVELRVEIKL